MPIYHRVSRTLVITIRPHDKTYYPMCICFGNTIFSIDLGPITRLTTQLCIYF